MQETVKFIYRDYQLVDGWLKKDGIDDNKHLLWSFGGIPAIDAPHVFDKYKNQIKNIIVTTKKGRVFQVSAEIFDQNKKEIDFGYGKQYFLEKHFWNIHDPVKRQLEYQKEIIEKEKLKQLPLL